MNKIILVFVAIIILIFLLPIIFTQSYQVSDASNNIAVSTMPNSEENVVEKNIDAKNIHLSDYDYKEYKNIRLLHSSTGEVDTMNLDEYLLGVVSAEMPATFEQEALNAQAVVARTYTIYTIKNNQGKHSNADICDDSKCCQAWLSKEDRLTKWDENVREANWNKIELAVKSTVGKVIIYQGNIIDAFFHANSGGVTETPINVWGGTNYPYLQSVQTSGEEGYTQYSSEVTLSKAEFEEKVKAKHTEFAINYGDADAIKILEYTDSGRVKTIKVGNLNLAGIEVRNIFALKSTNFKIDIEGNNIKFEVIGYGHGVGMSQTGADSMAKTGSNYMEIIKHFYIGVNIVDF